MTKKVVLVLLIITLLISSTNIVKAGTVSNIISGGQSFIDKGNQGQNPIDGDSIKNLSDIIYNVLLLIGIITAVIIGAVLGIQFITGSVEQKAKIKDSLIPYVVGCIVIFGAFEIWKLVVNIGASI